MISEDLDRAFAELESDPRDLDVRRRAFELAARHGRLGDALDRVIGLQGDDPDAAPDPDLVQLVAAHAHGLGDPRNLPARARLTALTAAGGVVAGVRTDLEVVVASPPDHRLRAVATLPPDEDDDEVEVGALRLSADGRRLAVGVWRPVRVDGETRGHAQAISVVDLEAGEVRHHLPAQVGQVPLWISPDATRAVLGPDLRVLDLETGETSAPWREALGPDHLAASVAAGAEPGRVHAVLLRTGWPNLEADEWQPRVVTLDLDQPGSAPRADEAVEGAFALAEDLAGGDPWVLYRGRHVRRFHLRRLGSEGERLEVHHDPDYGWVAGGDRVATAARVFSTEDASLRGVLPFVRDHAEPEAVHPGRPVPATYEGRVQLVDPGTGALVAWRDRHRAPVTGLALDPAGRLWSRSDGDGEERSWQLDTGAVVDARWRTYAPGSIHPELFAQVAVGAAADSWAYRVIRRDDGAQVAGGSLEASWDPPRAGLVSPAGDRLLVSSHTGRAFLVDLASGAEVWRHGQVGVHGAVAAFHPDGSQLLYAYPAGSETILKLVDPATGELLAEAGVRPDLRDMGPLLASTRPGSRRWMLTHSRGALVLDLGADSAAGEDLGGAAAFVPGTDWLVRVDDDLGLVLRDPDDEEQAAEVPVRGRIRALAVAPGPVLFVGARHYIRRWAWPEGWPVPPGHDAAVPGTSAPADGAS